MSNTCTKITILYLFISYIFQRYSGGAKTCLCTTQFTPLLLVINIIFPGPYASLKSTTEGRTILSSYKAMLDNNGRRKLCNLIVR